MKLVGFADYPTLGPTHSEINAKDLIKQFKNIQGYFPDGSQATENAVYNSYKYTGPCFISLKTDKNLNKNW